MHHATFGDLRYVPDDLGWHGTCHLAEFAAYGRGSNCSLDDPSADFLRGDFPLLVRDPDGSGPSPAQADTLKFFLGNETDVCRAVMTALLECFRETREPARVWLEARRDSWLWGWLARRFPAPHYRTIEDLKPEARCIEVELADTVTDGYVATGFTFVTADCLDVEHGRAVVYHPVAGVYWGDGSALDA
jgi:hypothetical protein